MMAATSPEEGNQSSRRKMKTMKKRSKKKHQRHKRQRHSSPSPPPSASGDENNNDGYSSSTSEHSSSSSSSSSSSRSFSSSPRRGGDGRRRHQSSRRRDDDRKRRHHRHRRRRSPSTDNEDRRVGRTRRDTSSSRDNNNRYKNRSSRSSRRRSDSRGGDDRHHRRRHRSHGRRRRKDEERQQQHHHQPSEQNNNNNSNGRKRKKRKQHHRRSTSSGSSRDDTIGHFKGGPGTLVGNDYRIIRDVGLGTFGRVVQCERIRHQRNGDNNDYHRSGSSRSGSRSGSNRHHHRSSSKDNGRADRSSSRHSHNGRNNNNGNNNGNNNNTNNTVAIKIVRNVRRYYESALIEGDICERVNREQSRHNIDLCAKMLDRFSLSSTGHYCLVFECLGMSLYDFLKQHEYRPFPMYCVQDFARQMLQAVDFLHGFQLIHTDLKPENILLVTNEEMTYRNNNWDGSVQRVPVRTKVKLIDFGGATYNDEKKSSIINTRQYRAPEVILGWGWSYPSDLWSLGCIIAELYRGELLFATHDNFEHVALMERAVGPFPRECLDKATNSLTRECFDTRGWHKIGAVLSPRSIEHVRKMAPVEMLIDERDRRSGLGQLLRDILTIDPKHRATAREALMSPFFAQRIGG